MATRFATLSLSLLVVLTVVLVGCGDSSSNDDGVFPDSGTGTVDTRGGDAPGPDACVPQCDQRQCGPDGCGGTCGGCTDDAVCYDGVCCMADCDGKQCGPDGCGGSCGGCEGGDVCLDYTCCTPQCDGLECGPDGCGGACGECRGIDICTAGVCCTPECNGRDCGSDGCMGSCGECNAGAICIDGDCCEPSCAGRECGMDGCGGTCGSCEAPRFCNEGICSLPDRDDDGIPDLADPFPEDSQRPGEARAEVVYAHSARSLYEMDVKTYQMQLIGEFEGMYGETYYDERMTDMAIDAYGVLWGVSYLRLYTCNPVTAHCTLMVDLEDAVTGNDIYEVNALTMVPGELFGELRDVLIGVANDGGWHRFDVDFEEHIVTVTKLGEYGQNRRSSGDAYSIYGIGTFAVVDEEVGGEDIDDYIVEVNPLTGETRPTPVAMLPGYQHVFGLAGWTEHAFAFDSSGDIMVVDMSTGQVATTLVHHELNGDVALCYMAGNPAPGSASNPVCTNGEPIQWWGAGVRTRVEQ